MQKNNYSVKFDLNKEEKELCTKARMKCHGIGCTLKSQFMELIERLAR